MSNLVRYEKRIAILVHQLDVVNFFQSNLAWSFATFYVHTNACFRQRIQLVPTNNLRVVQQQFSTAPP